MEHPQRYDDRGYVKVINRTGTVTTLAGEFWGEEGIAWSADGSTVYFGASANSSEGRNVGELSYQIYSVPADGRGRAAFALTSPGDFTIHDMNAKGWWLATREENRYGVVARGAGQTEERDLTWLNKSWGPALSPDGQRLLFSDGNGGPDYAAVWRQIDGSPVVRLGDGDNRGWSPDGKWALGMITSRHELFLYPIGAGDPVRLDTRPVTHLQDARFLADSASVALFGSEPGQPSRYFRLSIKGGPPAPMLTDDVIFAVFAPDGTTAVGLADTNALMAYPLAGGPPRPLGILNDDDTLVSFSEDSRWVFIQRGVAIPAAIDRVDVTTGKRTFFREFAPRDQAEFIRMYVTSLSADGSRYAYGYVKRPSVLFVVDQKRP
jgi:sugar lactone lactonase YvrE